MSCIYSEWSRQSLHHGSDIGQQQQQQYSGTIWNYLDLRMRRQMAGRIKVESFNMWSMKSSFVHVDGDKTNYQN